MLFQSGSWATPIKCKLSAMHINSNPTRSKSSDFCAWVVTILMTGDVANLWKESGDKEQHFMYWMKHCYFSGVWIILFCFIKKQIIRYRVYLDKTVFMCSRHVPLTELIYRTLRLSYAILRLSSEGIYQYTMKRWLYKMSSELCHLVTFHSGLIELGKFHCIDYCQSCTFQQC